MLEFQLFFGCFNFMLSYRTGSKNGKPDILSKCFGSLDDVPQPDTILPSGHVVGAVVWAIKDRDRRALV